MSRILIAALAFCMISPALAAPPYQVRDMQALDTAVRAACPQIDGVAADGTIFFRPGATCQNAANAAAQSFVAPPLAPVAVQINSSGTPAINAAYSIDPQTTAKVMALVLYIQANGRFPAGYSALPFPDASGALHTFTSPAQFVAFATALADYTTAVTLGGSPPTPVTIP